MEEATFKFVQGGIEVYPTSRAKLPGVFLNMLQAQRALDKYKATAKVPKAKRGRTNV